MHSTKPSCRDSDQSYFDEVVDYCDIATVTVRDGGLYTE